MLEIFCGCIAGTAQLKKGEKRREKHRFGFAGKIFAMLTTFGNIIC